MLLCYATYLALIFVITYCFCCHFTYDITGDTTCYCVNVANFGKNDKIQKVTL